MRTNTLKRMLPYVETPVHSNEIHHNLETD